MDSLFSSKEKSKDKKREETPILMQIPHTYTFIKWVVANKQAAFNEKYRMLLISQAFADKLSGNYWLKP